jgi:hypothetical protein
MQFFKRFGLGLATSLFSLILVVFALAFGTFMTLDKPATVKSALSQSGVYQLLVDNTLLQKQDQLSVYLPVENTGVQKAIRDAFPPTYLQSTTERNIDATYAWIHGITQQPQYSADLSGPKAALAANISQLVNQKVATLPVCTDVSVTPTTVADVLNLDCRPKGVSTSYLVAAAQQGVEQSSLFDKVVAPVLTLQDAQGKSLTSSLSSVPAAYHKFTMSLYVMPVVLILCGLAILFWSESRRRGAKTISRSLIITGIITILLSLGIVWLLGKAAQWTAGSSGDLLLIENKVVEIAHLIGSQLRNWLVGIGAGYVVIGVGLLALTRIVGTKNTKHNRALNKSLGYSESTPAAGTRFDPQTTSRQEAGAPRPHRSAIDPDYVVSKRPGKPGNKQ